MRRRNKVEIFEWVEVVEGVEVQILKPLKPLQPLQRFYPLAPNKRLPTLTMLLPDARASG